VESDDTGPAPEVWQDSIERLVRRLKGEVLVVLQPVDLSRAIKHVAARFYPDREVQLSSGQMAVRR
jgi:hypothetical protein